MGAKSYELWRYDAMFYERTVYCSNGHKQETIQVNNFGLSFAKTLI